MEPVNNNNFNNVELMTEVELIDFLRFPEVNANGYMVIVGL